MERTLRAGADSAGWSGLCGLERTLRAGADSAGWSGLCGLPGWSGLWSGLCGLTGRSGLRSGLCDGHHGLRDHRARVHWRHAGCLYRPHGWILQLTYQPRHPGVCCSFDSRNCRFIAHHLRHTSHFSWGTCQRLHKLPKCQVVQPPHPPPAEGLIQGTVEEVLEGPIVVPPHVIALLMAGAQALELEDALV